MGWSFGWGSRKELLAHLLESDHWEPLRHACVGNILWVVFGAAGNGQLDPLVAQVTSVLEGQPNWIACFMMRGGRNQEWGYKPLEESMGPGYYSCPLAYLDMAKPVNPEWREQVRKYHAERKLTFKLQPGQLVEVRRCSIKSARIERLVGRRIIALGDDGYTYRLPRTRIGRLLEPAPAKREACLAGS